MAKQPPYPEEFRREAVQLVLSGRSKMSVADSLGCSPASLTNWVNQHLADSGALPEQMSSAEKAEWNAPGWVDTRLVVNSRVVSRIPPG